MRATIDDVARLAGVSPSTVSQVYSSNRPVRNQTRQRVLEAAAKLRYRPSSSARALATGRTLRLLLHLPVEGETLARYPYLLTLLTELSRCGAAKGYAFLLTTAASWHPILESAGGYGAIDGVLVIDPTIDDELPANLAKRDIPFVSLGRVAGGEAPAWVTDDLDTWCRLLLAHFEQTDYLRPALIDEVYGSTWAEDVVAAFRRAEPADIDILHFVPEATQDGVAAAFDGPQPPDIYVCSSPATAQIVQSEAARRGLRIPEDVGFVLIADELASSNVGESSPTILQVSAKTAAHNLVRLLDELIVVGDTDGERVYKLGATLVTGATTRPPHRTRRGQ